MACPGKVESIKIWLKEYRSNQLEEWLKEIISMLKRNNITA